MSTKTRTPCPDCEAQPGQLHEGTTCDVESCPCCGGQLLTCGCTTVEHPGWSPTEPDSADRYLLELAPGEVFWWPDDSIRLPWTGIMYEREAEAAAADGQFVRSDGPPWRPCEASDPLAQPFTNYGVDKLLKPCPFR